ncbi:MAG: P-type conjugative transfer protein TrbG, partial [Planctomycetota bacterium]
MKLLSIVIAVLVLAGCASKTPPPKIQYDSVDFHAAVVEAEVPKPVEIIEVPRPLPLPGQLKPRPTSRPSPASDDLAPEDRVEQGNAAARREPSLEGYVNAVQVYPYTKGALYQLYAAPEQVSD